MFLDCAFAKSLSRRCWLLDQVKVSSSLDGDCVQFFQSVLDRNMNPQVKGL